MSRKGNLLNWAMIIYCAEWLSVITNKSATICAAGRFKFTVICNCLLSIFQMAATLPYELLEMILEEGRNDRATLRSCILINKNWCSMAIQYLWAKPFTLLLSRTIIGYHSPRAANLMTTFIECFTDAEVVERESCYLERKYNK